jgi:hypothetical protein
MARTPLSSLSPFSCRWLETIYICRSCVHETAAIALEQVSFNEDASMEEISSIREQQLKVVLFSPHAICYRLMQTDLTVTPSPNMHAHSHIRTQTHTSCHTNSQRSSFNTSGGKTSASVPTLIFILTEPITSLVPEFWLHSPDVTQFCCLTSYAR